MSGGNSLQQGFIYHSLSQPDDDAYRVQTLLDYHGEFDVSAYQEAWRLAIQTYPSLRLCFNWDEDLIQIITQTGDLDFTYHDMSERLDKDETVLELQQNDRAVAFDLSKPTLLRLHVIKHTSTHHTLLKTEHHSISDGWSGPILLGQVHAYYETLASGGLPEVAEDTAYLRAQAYTSTHQADVTRYWDKQRARIQGRNDLNALLTQPTNLDEIKALKSPRSEEITLSRAMYHDLIQSEGLTVSTLVQFAWHKLIQVYTGDTQTIVGTTISGRTLPIQGIASSVGPYINTLPLIINWQDMSIREQLSYIQEQVSALNEHSFASLADLQTGGQRLFHSLLVFENYRICTNMLGNST